MDGADHGVADSDVSVGPQHIEALGWMRETPDSLVASIGCQLEFAQLGNDRDPTTSSDTLNGGRILGIRDGIERVTVDGGFGAEISGAGQRGRSHSIIGEVDEGFQLAFCHIKKRWKLIIIHRISDVGLNSRSDLMEIPKTFCRLGMIEGGLNGRCQQGGQDPDDRDDDEQLDHRKTMEPPEWFH